VNKSSDKTERWQQISLSAMKQSQRCKLPKVNIPLSFSEAIKLAKSDIKLIADERNNENISIKSIDTSVSSIDLFIGPEGGFTSGELDQAISNNFKVLKMGARKYRSETAAIAGIGLLLLNK
jgi:16S rRNA (uracil1498-N3)-methyltransferase